MPTAMMMRAYEHLDQSEAGRHAGEFGFCGAMRVCFSDMYSAVDVARTFNVVMSPPGSRTRQRVEPVEAVEACK